MHMDKYKVKTGDLKVEVEAKNHKMAVIKAIDEHNPTSLGSLISCLKKGDKKSEELFYHSALVLKDMGYDVYD